MSFGQVVDIPDQNLEKAIRDAIGKTEEWPILKSNLEDLTELNVKDKGIRDLTSLEYCANLTVLNLTKNQINDITPLSNLNSLIELNLSENQISDITPLYNLTNLNVLDLDHNKITEITHLSNLTSLTRLNLGGNQISDINPLSNLINLTWLDLNGNQIIDITTIANLTNLNELYLNGDQISDIQPLVQNEGLAKGDCVYLARNPLSDTSIYIYIPQLQARGVNVKCDFESVCFPDVWLREAIDSALQVIGKERPFLESDLKELTILEFVGYEITEWDKQYRITNLVGIEHCNNLSNLNLSENFISDLTPLSNLRNLRRLNLKQNHINDLTALSNLTNLNELYLGYNQINDIQPLVENEGLADGDYVNLASNPLSTASESTTYHAPDTDIVGYQRPLGSGIDMGAYEQFDDGSIPKSNPWDVNNDDKVDIFDLVMVGSSFGEAGNNLAADINNDGKVNLFDLVMVGSHFGEEIAAPSIHNISLLQHVYNTLKTVSNPNPNLKLALKELKKLLTPAETKLLQN